MPSSTSVGDVLVPGGLSELAAEAPPETDDPYWLFYDHVAAAELAAWLPTRRTRVLDLSGGRAPWAARLLIAAGHEVVRVISPSLWTDSERPTVAAAADAEDPTAAGANGATVPTAIAQRMGSRVARPAGAPALPRWRRRGRLIQVIGDPRSLDCIAPASVDAVLAEGRALSCCLAAEATAEELFRVLRPGGRLLACVDSLLLGLAQLAERHRWAELADVSSADVVLVEAPDGTITRCFGPEELRTLLTGAGFMVEWVRPRTVLSAEAVRIALTRDRASRATLVRTEVALAAEREGESIGIHLVASARRAGQLED